MYNNESPRGLISKHLKQKLQRRSIASLQFEGNTLSGATDKRTSINTIVPLNSLPLLLSLERH